MFSHHLRFGSNPRESPRRKQIVFDKPSCFVLPSRRVSLHSRYAITRSKTRFSSLLSLFLSSSQADMHCCCCCSLVYPKRVFRHLQSVWFCTLCFIKRIRSCLHIRDICMHASAVALLISTQYVCHQILYMRIPAYVYFTVCVFTQRSKSKYINN